MGAYATVVGRARDHVSTAAREVCDDVEEAVLEVGGGRNSTTDVLVCAFVEKRAAVDWV